MNKLFISLLFTALTVTTFNWGGIGSKTVYIGRCADLQAACKHGSKQACDEFRRICH